MKHPPLNRFKDSPRTASAWWAMVLGLASILEFPIIASISALQSESTATSFGPNIGFIGIPVTILALVFGFISRQHGERSWVLWLGFGPALLVGLVWITMIVAEVFSIIFNLGF